MIDKTVFIIGSGPSLTHRIQVDDSMVYVALNKSISLCDGIVDYHFMNDLENVDFISLEDRLRTHHVVIPSFPHIPLNDSGKCGPVCSVTSETFMSHYPIEFRDKFDIIELPTAPIKNKSLKSFPVRITVAESALFYMISLGYRRFRFIGVGDSGNSHTSLLNSQDVKGKVNFGNDVKHRVLEILHQYDCIYSFTTMFTYSDTLGNSYSLFSGTYNQGLSLVKKGRRKGRRKTRTIVNRNLVFQPKMNVSDVLLERKGVISVHSSFSKLLQDRKNTF